MSRRLLLLRHGRTSWNEAGRAQGHADIELDARGRAQADAVAAALASTSEISFLWSSDLARAQQTAERVGAATGLAVQYDARLREFDVGARQGLTVPEFAERFPDAFEEWSSGDSMVPVRDGESAHEVHRRIVPALQESLDSLSEGQTGLVVAHGAALKLGIVGLLGWPIESHLDFAVLDNCALATLEVAGSAGRVRLAGYNHPAEPTRGARG